jgi:hypothetical protein
LDGRKIFRGDCSETIVQRQGGWAAIKVQMESLMPNLSKITKLRGLRKWFLYMCGYLALKPFQAQTHVF